jgi:hypothetical protein
LENARFELLYNHNHIRTEVDMPRLFTNTIPNEIVDAVIPLAISNKKRWAKSKALINIIEKTSDGECIIINKIFNKVYPDKIKPPTQDKIDVRNISHSEEFVNENYEEEEPDSLLRVPYSVLLNPDNLSENSYCLTSLLDAKLIDIVEGKVTRIDDKLVALKKRYLDRVSDILVNNIDNWHLTYVSVDELVVQFYLEYTDKAGAAKRLKLEFSKYNTRFLTSELNRVLKITGLEEIFYKGVAQSFGKRMIQDMLQVILTTNFSNTNQTAMDSWNERCQFIRQLAQYT